MKQIIILFLWYLISKISGIKNWIFILGIVAPILGCSKQKTESGNCVSLITYKNGIEIKRVTSQWENTLMKSDTIFCDDETIITLFQKCSQP